MRWRIIQVPKKPFVSGFWEVVLRDMPGWETW